MKSRVGSTLAFLAPSLFLIPQVAGAVTLREAVDQGLKNFPNVTAAQLDIITAQAARGALWESLTAISAQYGQVLSPISHVNIQGYADPFRVNTASVQGGVQWSPLTTFQRTDAATAIEQAKVAATLTQNQIAQLVTTLYLQVVFGREEVITLQNAFLPITTVLAKDPSVQADKQILLQVNTLAGSLQGSWDGACTALTGADAAYRLLVGAAPGGAEPLCEQNVVQFSGIPNAGPGDNLDGINDLIANIPIFQDDTDLVQLVANSPTMKATALGVALQKHQIRETNWWAGLQLAVGVGPSYEEVHPLNKTDMGVTWGVTLPFSFHTKALHGAAQTAYASAQKKSDGQKIQTVETAAQEFVQYFGARNQLCDIEPLWEQQEANLIALGQDLSKPIDGSALALAGTVPLALGTWSAINASLQLGLNAIIAMHVIAGDLAGKWDASHNPDQAAYCAVRATQIQQMMAPIPQPAPAGPTGTAN